MNKFRAADEIMGYNSETFQERLVKGDYDDDAKAVGMRFMRRPKTKSRAGKDTTPGCPIPLVGRMIEFD